MKPELAKDGRLCLKAKAGPTTTRLSDQDATHPWPDTLFPLPLTYFENYMLVDDRPTHPMSIFVDIRLSGDLKRDAFEQAYQKSLDRHPLLQCVVRKIRRRWHWTPACHLIKPVKWASDSNARPAEGQSHIDLQLETGLRTWVEHQPDQSRVGFQFHHAATDGLGAVKFIGDLLAIYGQLTTPEGEESPELLPVTFGKLRDRGQLWTEGQSRIASMRRVLECTWEFVTQVPKPLATPPRARLHEASEPSMPNMASRKVDKETTKAIKREAAKRLVSANDLYSLVLFQTMRRWNQLHDIDGRPSTMRVGVPVTLRTPHHEDSPAANILSYMALTSFADDDPDQLLKRISRRAAQTVGGVDGPVFTLGVGGVMTHLPWFGRYCSNHPNYCFTTAVLTNIGEVRRAVGNRFPLRKGHCVAGSVTLEALLGTAPVRPQTAVAIALGTYGGHLFINANCDPYTFSNKDARAFLDLYIETLEQLVDESQQVVKKSA
ncbi:MAG: hypothetical protein KDA93_18410 [Planctomycetaceae bacterium]|nr:hypothetical protein [Planctomycetaceae bacterium]